MNDGAPSPRGRRRAHRAGLALGGLLVILALALAGVWLGLRIASPGEYETELGRVSVRVTPAAHGQVEAYVPLADWGVRAHAFRAPMKLHIEPRTVDRDVVLRAASGEEEPVRAAEAGLRTAVRRTVLRTVRFALGGAALLAAMLGLTLAAVGVRRRAVVAGAPVAVVAVAALVCGATVWRAQASFDERAFDHPTFYARGAELVQLLDAATNARAAGDGYTTKVQGAVRGFASLLADPAAGRLDATRPALLASDLHNNRLVLDSLRDYARDKPVFFVGDFGNTGSRAEARLLGGAVARLGREVVAVSGNHDSTAFMRTLARRGVTVLTREGVLRPDGRHGAESVEVAGLRVAGFDDPQEWRGPDPGDPRRIFSFSELPDAEQAVERARRQLLRWFDGLDRRPDVVLMHQNGLAQWLAATLQARGEDRPLAILTGHDHRQHVTSYGAITVVDAGTAGASGIYGVGRDEVGLGDLHFAPDVRALQAADLIAVEPVSGAAQAQRVVTTGACPTPAERDGACRRFPEPDASADPAE
ncbi:MAG TPA: metallophosphoesterase family protein [Solirubrobacteraceae bacterium]|nr:metallophosphoesterase family protein [Solirubrobacteraceae bacterium]